MSIEPYSPLYNDVERLHNELSAALSWKSKLEMEIQRLSQSISPGPCGSLSILPIELLIEIFDLIVVANPAHRNRLMLVCRSWSQIIIETPQLWTNVKIVVPIKPEELKQCASYCVKCVERSGALPLDIDIRYSGFRALPGDFWQPLGTACAATFEDPDIHWRWKSPYLRQLSSFYETLDRPDDAFYKYHWERYLAPLRIFSGKSFSVMRRWKSFSLIAGKIGFDKSIFAAALHANLFGGHTPLLQRLVIKYTPGLTRDGDEGCEYRTFMGLKSLSFPFLPKINELLLINLALPLPFESLNPKRITDLSLHTHEQFPFICSNLVTLRLGFSHKRVIQFDPGTNPVVFPFLNRLEVSAPLAPAFWERIVAPRMIEIVFQFNSALGVGYYGTTFPPSTSRVECRWSYEQRAMEAMLISILQIPSLDTLLITRTIRDRAVRIIKKLRDTGVPVPRVISVPHNYDTDPSHEDILPI